MIFIMFVTPALNEAGVLFLFSCFFDGCFSVDIMLTVFPVSCVIGFYFVILALASISSLEITYTPVYLERLSIEIVVSLGNTISIE